MLQECEDFGQRNLRNHSKNSIYVCNNIWLVWQESSVDWDTLNALPLRLDSCIVVFFEEDNGKDRWKQDNLCDLLLYLSSTSISIFVWFLRF